MKITLVAVTSMNGKITKGESGDIYEWSSKEDRKHFENTREKFNLIVMGASTYGAIKSFVKLSPDKLRVVMTRNPDEYSKEEVHGQLEFSSESPKKLVERLSGEYKELMLVGGGITNALFLKEGLVDEILLTIEPVVFGEGRPFFAEGDYAKSFRLISVIRLNEKGTLLLKYKKYEN